MRCSARCERKQNFMARFFLTVIVTWFIGCSSSVFAQMVNDDDKRSFDALHPIFIDVDGDGTPDKIQPRTYQTCRRHKGKRLLKSHIRNWITFDLATTRGRSIKSFFTYNYGTAEQAGSYWVYALIPAGDINGDGLTDLIFYSGDDTSDETVTLINHRNRFFVRSKKVSDADDWIRESTQASSDNS